MNSTEKYFSCKYPERSSKSRLLFRHGEAVRIKIVRNWLTTTRNLEILDAGCGDGQFVVSILAGMPRKVRVEDLVSHNVASACASLSGLTVVEGRIGDALQQLDKSRFDLVLAIGLLDYQHNWQDALVKLTNRSRGVLVANLPRANHPRNLLRYAWLKWQGVKLNLVGRQHMINTLKTIGLPFDIQSTQLEWFIRIDCKGVDCVENYVD